MQVYWYVLSGSQLKVLCSMNMNPLTGFFAK